MSTRPNKESWVSGLTVPNRIIAFTAHRKNYKFRHMVHPQKARNRHVTQTIVCGTRHLAVDRLYAGIEGRWLAVIDLQRDALLSAGVTERHLYSDTASGKHDDRPGLAACLQALGRATRSSSGSLIAWAAVCDILSTPFTIDQSRHWPEGPHRPWCRGRHDHACGQVGLRHFCCFGGFEHALIVERTRAGLASARARGRKGGRRPKSTPAKLRLAMAAMGKPETNVGDLCAELGVTRSTLYRHVSPAGEPRGHSRQ